MKLTRKIIGLIICLIIAIISYMLDNIGIALFMLSESYSFMYFLFIVSACFAGYFGLILLTTLKVQLKQGNDGEVKMLGGLYKVLFFFALLMGLMLVLGKIQSFGAFFSMFGGMLLGWSLQAPVSGFAAWVMVIMMRPYKLGDRIQFPSLGLIGDVVKFSPMYLTLNQVGGTIGSEEPVGRMIHVPNAMLFAQVAINYTYKQQKESGSYILDEAVFRITLDSDWDTVEKVLLNTAREVTKNIIEETGTEPYVRADTWEYGTLFRLRYMTDATDRPRIMYEIVKRATKEIQKNKNVDLAIPYVYSFKRGYDGASTASKHSETIEELGVDSIQCEKLEDENFWKENENEIYEIAKNINEMGLLQPVIVVRNMDDDNYTLLFGEKRLKACMLLGWEKIPAIIRNKYGAEIYK